MSFFCLSRSAASGELTSLSTHRCSKEIEVITMKLSVDYAINRLFWLCKSNNNNDNNNNNNN